jgi:SAM-dependent methyltransferase
MAPPVRNTDVGRWWADNPMTYGQEHGSTAFSSEGATQDTLLGSPEFFENVDRTFYVWNHPLHDASGYFGKIFPYERYRSRRVLEVGCGMGTMAMNWARHGALVFASDLNLTAVTQTRRRFLNLGLASAIVQMDANTMPYADDSFDYVYSWGVLHHSPDLDSSVREMFRILRPGGEFGVMLYCRDSLLFRYSVRYLEGFLHGESRFLNPLQLASRYADGDRAEGNPHTWPVTEPEMESLFKPFCSQLSFQRLGTEIDSIVGFILPIPGLARRLPGFLKKPWARRWGWSLWISGQKTGAPQVSSNA